MKRRMWILIAAIMLLTGSATVVQARQPKADCPPNAPRAQRGPGMMGHGIVDWMIELGLDDKQIVKISQLRQDHMKKVLPLKRELHDLMDQRQELDADPAANRDSIVKLSKRQGEIRAELEGMHIDLMSDAKKVLSKEQLEKLGEGDLFGMGHRGKMRDGYRHHRGPGMPPTPPPAPGLPNSERE